MLNTGSDITIDPDTKLPKLNVTEVLPEYIFVRMMDIASNSTVGGPALKSWMRAAYALVHKSTR